jgi:hypothetical protein
MEKQSTLFLEAEQTHRTHPPKGFRESASSGNLACPHRDVSCCASCAAAHPEIVEVFKQHFWTASEQEKQELSRALEGA